jgi:hypothetical protein
MKKLIFLALTACALVAFAQPSVISVAPLNGSGTSATFTSVYRHSGGVNQNYLAYLLILPTPNIVWFTAKGSCLIEYNRISNGMRLIDDAGTGWLGGQSGIPVGPGGSTLGNSYCSVNTAAVTRTLGATDVTVTVPVHFTSNLTGVMGTFTQALDVNGVWTGMTQFGNWTANPIAYNAKPGPYIRSASAPAYSLVPTYVDLFSGHTSGYSSLSMVNILLADSIVGGTNRCHIIYFALTNQIKLVNDAGTDFVPATPPQHNTVCAIGNFRGDLMYSSVSSSEVHLHIPLDYNPDKVKQKLKIWINTFDINGKLTHWQGLQ